MFHALYHALCLVYRTVCYVPSTTCRMYPCNLDVMSMITVNLRYLIYVLVDSGTALNVAPRNGMQTIIIRNSVDNVTVFYSYPPVNSLMNIDRLRE